MNASIQAIFDKVEQYLRSKAAPNPNPALVWANDEAELFEDLATVVDGLVSQAAVPPPVGVKWITAPLVTIDGNELAVTGGQVSNEGTIFSINSAEITLPAVAAGQQRPYALVANYNAVPLVYEVVAGDISAENTSFTYPPLPPGRLWVAYFLVTEAGVIQSAAGAIKQLQDATGTLINPDANGVAALPLNKRPTRRISSTNLTAGEYVIQESDHGYTLRCSNGTDPITIIIPAQLEGFDIVFHQEFAESPIIFEADNTTIFSNNGSLQTSAENAIVWAFSNDNGNWFINHFDTGIAYKTGTVIKFDTESTYNSRTTPGSGNITFDLTGARNVIQKLYIKMGTEPTVNGLAIGNNSSSVKKLSSSGDFSITDVNIFYFEYNEEDGTIDYNITQ